MCFSIPKETPKTDGGKRNLCNYAKELIRRSTADVLSWLLRFKFWLIVFPRVEKSRYPSSCTLRIVFTLFRLTSSSANSMDDAWENLDVDAVYSGSLVSGESRSGSNDSSSGASRIAACAGSCKNGRTLVG